MHLTECIKPYIPEEPGKSEEILILTPAAGREPKYHDRKLVLTFPVNKRRQVKISRSKTVLGISHVVSVKPDCYATLGSLKRNIYRSLSEILRKVKIPDIACHRIEVLGYLPRFNLFEPVPRILRVGILGAAVAFGLYMSRNPYPAPLTAVIILLVKILYRRIIIYGIVKPPYSV